ncbi:MAG: hypothetical protein PHP32_04545 [Candidatus Izemoplasmatales bacterium]|nr:hypothetical protein [Candidatus Izemoplasmatales bacterium]
MKCVSCGCYFAQETNFGSMFFQEKECPRCLRLLQAKPIIEVLPYSGGRLWYETLLEEEPLNECDRSYLWKKSERSLRSAIHTDQHIEVILFLEELELVSFPKWFPWIKAFGDLWLISLVRFPLERYVMKF